MKIIGIIGGMSCESTGLYYKWLNEGTRARLGGLHSAELVLWSVDFARIEAMQNSGDWSSAGEELAAIAGRLEGAGAEIIILATNTMHRVAASIEEAIDAIFVHIADPTGAAIRSHGLQRPGLMATGHTMLQPFYADRLRESYGLEVLVPQGADGEDTHRIIYQELCRGIVSEESRARYVEIAARLVKRGADSIILGCTEIGLLLDSSNVAVPVFDTARIHVQAALDAAIGRNAIGNAA